MKKELKYGEPVLTEDQCALLQTLVPKPFEGLAIKPCVPAHKRFKTEADAEAMLAWQKLKSECVLVKKAR
jgi:hypothetical protein